MKSEEAWAQAQGQGTLQPGEQGWWRVWGANITHVRAGDILLAKGDAPTLIAERFEAKAAPLRQGFVSAEGERFTMGAMARIEILRPGTHNTLA